MAINRFFKPVEYEYTPIPFDQLVQIGKELNTQRAQAEKDLTSNIRTFGKFVSPSAADMQNYQRESIGKLAPFLEQAAANPEVMKDAAWRAQMLSAINNIDYAKLGMYEQSAANLNARLLNIAKMEAAGKYNPNWDRLNISAWNSDVQGVMNDLTPIEYQTLESFGDPFVKNLKPTFYKGVDPNNPKNKLPYTNWMSITRDDIARQFAQHVDDIKSDPQGREHYNDITSAYLRSNPNATQKELDEIFIDALTTRQLDKVISTPVIDQVGLKFAAAKYEYDLENPSGDTPTNSTPYITPREQLSNQYQSNFNDYIQRNLTDPTRKDYKEDQKLQQVAERAAIYSANKARALEEAGAPTEVVNLARMQAVYYGQESAKQQLKVNRKEFSNMYGSNEIGPKDFDNFDKDVDWGKFEKVSKDFIDNMGGQITLTDSHDMLKHVAAPATVTWSGGESNGFVLNNSSEFVLPFRLASTALQITGDLPMNKNNFVNAVESGLYKNVKIIPHAHGTSFADQNSPTGKREYVKATAVFNVDDVNLDQYIWMQSATGTLGSWYEEIGKFIQGGYAERAVKEMGGKYNSDTNTVEIDVYVPIGESNQQAEDYNFEKGKTRFGTTANKEDRYDYTYRTNKKRLNTGYYGEEE